MGQNRFSSWTQSSQLASGKTRKRAHSVLSPEAEVYALVLGPLAGARGQLLFSILLDGAPRCAGQGALKLRERRRLDADRVQDRQPYQREREALHALGEEHERRHKAELAALEAQMQAKLEALTRFTEYLARRLDRASPPEES